MKQTQTHIRTLERRYLKAECVEEYLEYHRAVWPELEELYLRNGVTSISCFVNGVELLVLYECDAAIYNELKATIADDPVEQRWQALMRTFIDTTQPITQFEEVYRLTDRRASNPKAC